MFLLDIMLKLRFKKNKSLAESIINETPMNLKDLKKSEESSIIIDKFMFKPFFYEWK